LEGHAGSGVIWQKIGFATNFGSPLVNKAGIRRLDLHSTRHTFASRLIAQGENLKYIQEQLGHASITITVDTYGHLIPGGNRQAVDRLDYAATGSETGISSTAMA
jgi:integrase